MYRVYMTNVRARALVALVAHGIRQLDLIPICFKRERKRCNILPWVLCI